MATKDGKTASVLYEVRPSKYGTFDVVEVRTTIILVGASRALADHVAADLNGGSDTFKLLTK